MLNPSAADIPIPGAAAAHQPAVAGEGCACAEKHCCDRSFGFALCAMHTCMMVPARFTLLHSLKETCHDRHVLRVVCEWVCVQRQPTCHLSPSPLSRAPVFVLDLLLILLPVVPAYGGSIRTVGFSTAIQSYHASISMRRSARVVTAAAHSPLVSHDALPGAWSWGEFLLLVSDCCMKHD